MGDIPHGDLPQNGNSPRKVDGSYPIVHPRGETHGSVGCGFWPEQADLTTLSMRSRCFLVRFKAKEVEFDGSFV